MVVGLLLRRSSMMPPSSRRADSLPNMKPYLQHKRHVAGDLECSERTRIIRMGDCGGTRRRRRRRLPQLPPSQAGSASSPASPAETWERWESGQPLAARSTNSVRRLHRRPEIERPSELTSVLLCHREV